MFNFFKDLLITNKHSERVIIFFSIILFFTIIDPKSSNNIVKMINVLTGSIFKNIEKVTFNDVLSTFNLLSCFLIFMILYAVYWEMFRKRIYISLFVLNEYLYYHTICCFSLFIFLNLKYGVDDVFNHFINNFFTLNTFLVFLSTTSSGLLVLSTFISLFIEKRS